jgi:hypothetical protein
MTSPFPGMDPYLEDPAFWEDFHRRFITAVADALLRDLPDGYDAHMDERVRLVEAAPDGDRTRLPDVSVDATDAPAGVRTATASPATAAGTAGSVAVLMESIHEQRDVWIEIVHLPERSLVTAIEVLSPTNKSGDGYVEYRTKRMDFIARRANLVELDLLLGGRRLAFRQPLPPADYYAFVTRPGRLPYVDVHPWSLRDRLPAVPVPLRPPDADLTLDVAAVFAETFERGRYGRRLRYARPLPGPMSPADATWATSIAAGGD